MGKQTMNDKTEQALTDALIDQIESAARASFRRHQDSIKGQLLTAADNFDWHLLHAAYQAGIHAMRAQLAEAQRDAERLDWIIEHRAYVVSDPDCCDGYWLNYARPDGTVWTQATEHETPRAAIDAAKGPA